MLGLEKYACIDERSINFIPIVINEIVHKRNSEAIQ